MRIAVIDIGTNSTRLLIVDYKENNNYKIIDRQIITTRLGEGVNKNKKLKKGAMKRVINAIASYDKLIKNKKVEKIKIAGTSALREVDNSNRLIKLLNDKFGYELEVISGLKEARVIYKGVQIDINQADILIIDIGGGSTEFIKKSEDSVKYKSLTLGAVRITEKYVSHPEKKISNKKINKIRTKIKNILHKKFDKNWYCNKMAGVGGTITTAAAIKLKLENYDSDKIHKTVVEKESISNMMYELSDLNLDARNKIKGLQSERADIIVGGFIILVSILDFFSVDSIIVSENDILMGMVREVFEVNRYK